MAIKINESKFPLKDGEGEGVIAVFLYSGESHPVITLDEAIKKYTDGHNYSEFVDSKMDMPWVRVVITDINNMNQEDFDSAKHKIKDAVVKTSKAWFEEECKDKEIVIIDPDGWDRNNYDHSFNEELITKEEFWIRVSKSTIKCNFTKV